jgi:Flp pilus assembly protein TadD
MRLISRACLVLMSTVAFAQDCVTFLPTLRQALDRDPQSVEALLNLGVNQFRCGQSADALVPLRKAIELAPSNSTALFYLGASLLALDRDEEARNAFGRMAELSPANTDQLFLLQKAYTQLSAALVKRMSEITPESPRLNQVRAELLEIDHQPDRAIQEYKIALQKAPNLPSLHYALGCVYWARFQAADALAEFRKAIQLDPVHYMAHYKAGMALIELNQLDLATRELSEALRLQPGLANAHLGLAKVYWRTGKYDRAMTSVDECLRADSTNQPALYLRTQILQKLGRKDEAEQQAQHFRVLHDADPVAKPK